MVSFIISGQDSNQRMDKYVKKILKEAPDSFIYKMMRKKNIVLNGKKCDGKEVLCEKDEIKIFLSDETFEKFSGRKVKKTSTSLSEGEILSYQKAFESMQLSILYENKHALFVSKPQGVLSQKASADDISINEWLIGYLLEKKEVTPLSLVTFKPSVCNRLDRNTSGIVVCAKTLVGAQVLGQLIASKELEKYYYTLVCGEVKLEDRLSGYLCKNKSKNKVTVYKTLEDIPEKQKKDAEFIDTSFHTIKASKQFTMLEVQLFTGKSHQIRAHLASIGHPVLGDEKYGDSACNLKFHVHTQLLHAYKLVFPKLSDPEFADLSGREILCDLPESFHNFNMGEK